jgi:hypothetical protein
VRLHQPYSPDVSYVDASGDVLKAGVPKAVQGRRERFRAGLRDLAEDRVTRAIGRPKKSESHLRRCATTAPASLPRPEICAKTSVAPSAASTSATRMSV